ncbi:MAG: hypothetical protein FWG99_02260 [Treponema sp.]|nr:hypothetical protein [Treponema sp.]
MKNRYQSEALQVIHEDMMGMHQLGIISDERMREFDEMCLIKEPKPVYEADNFLIAEQIKHATV